MKKYTKIFVLLFASLVVQCSAMSLSELEDFANFLKKTSQLDETLKKGTDVNDFDEDDTVSDHAWEESGKFEGDLILNERQRRMIVEDIAEGLSRNGLRDSTKRWPDNELVYYIQKEHFSEGQVQAIQSGIEDLARASCVKFRPYRKGDRDAVVIQGSRRGCFSQVGYQGGYQVLNLSGRHPVGRGCFRHGTVVHELLHSLGFYHMQSSPDRDDYVDIAWENIVQPARHNFRKYNAFSVSDFGVGYDYDSVLHYSRRAFSSNGQDTILPKQGGAQIGQREGLSNKDAQKLNKMYCDADNNDEGNDSTTQKATIKKKIPKNKPFEGHGIGYHQGKTVVIKLVPAAETYHVVNKPAFPMFDYFSKAPQVLSPKEIKNFGPGKEIEESYIPYTYSKGYPPQTHNVIPGFKGVKYKGIGNEVTSELKPIKAERSPNSTQVTQKEDRLGTEKGNVEKSSEVKDDEDLSDAFKRLAKILKTHVYPTNFPDLKAYKINTDYSEFENPETQPKMDRETSKAYIESLYGNGPDSLNPETRSKTLNPEKVLQTTYEVSPTPYKENSEDNEEYIKKIFGEGDITRVKGFEKTFDKEKNPKEMYELVTLDKYKVPKAAEASYRTSYPFRKNQISFHGTPEIKTPDYALYENLKDKHNYSSLYLPYTDNTEPINRKYKLLGDYVPTYDDWYLKDHLKRNPVDYDRESYTYVTPTKGNIRIDDTSGSSESEPESEDGTATKFTGSFSPERKEAYTLYGEPVPLTENWYKVNSERLIDPRHYPYKYYTANENSESHEDDR